MSLTQRVTATRQFNDRRWVSQPPMGQL